MQMIKARLCGWTRFKRAFKIIGEANNKFQKKNLLCRAGSAEQRSLHSIQAHFCLLCCQPEPVPRSLAARLSQLTSRDHCRLQAWLGQALCTVCRTCTVPPHFIAIIRGNRKPKSPSECKRSARHGQRKHLVDFRQGGHLIRVSDATRSDRFVIRPIHPASQKRSCPQLASFVCFRIPFGDHPLQLQRYRQD